MKPILLASAQSEPNELELKNRDLARRAAAEGFVLLENDGILPLREKKIALFGAGARMTVKGGEGSGAVRNRSSISIEEGLINAGYEITTENWLDRFEDYYQNCYQNYKDEVEKKVAGVTSFYQILSMAGQFHHPTGIPVTDSDIEESGTDTAIYVLCRQAGEGFDRQDTAGDYRLDDMELENLEKISESYRNFIVIVNVGGLIDLSFMDQYHVSALVYFCQGGEEGGNALADVISGKNSFSGRLTTSWAADFEDIPSNHTYSYLGGDPHVQVYNEGIYVGYRYYETFGKSPRYPFGYGLSYTSFQQKVTSVSQEADVIRLQMSVENTGSAAGKDVIQIYAEVPYGTIGAEKRRLAAFTKTENLESQETGVYDLEIPVRMLAKYHEDTAQYVLEKGKYILMTGTDSHHVRPEIRFTLDSDTVLEQCMNVCPGESIPEEIVPAGREETDTSAAEEWHLDTSLLQTVQHRYETPEAENVPDHIRKIVSSMNEEELAELVCGSGTDAENLIVQATGASGSTTSGLYEKYGIPNIILSDGPQGLNLTSQVVELPDGSLKAAYVPENLEAYKRYFFGVAKYGLMKKMAKPEEGTVHYQYATAMPCSQLLAQTFNTALVEEVGDAVGSEMEEFGVTVWLAPGINIQRNPLCGRTFEYYSEDPYVSGKTAAALIRGVQKHEGKGMSIKHFAANNCELERNSSSSNMSERTLREIYLRGFEIAVKESEPATVMAAYNMINGVYCTNNYDLLVRVLRNEWNFKGLVMSDWDSMKCVPGEPAKALTGDILKAHRAQCDLVMPGRPDQREALISAMQGETVSRDDLRRSAERILCLIDQNTVLKIRENKTN